MKSILSFMLGVLIIIFSNTIYNFIDVYQRIDFSLIYIIILSLYWRGKDYALCTLALLLGYILDVTSSMYQGQYCLLFLVIALLGIFIKDEIQKDYFLVPFFISTFFLVISAVFNTLISGISHKDMYDILFSNMIYIIINIVVLVVIIWIINTSINHWRSK